MLKGFKEFLARGNIVDLAVAVVIGTAFTGLVTRFTHSVIQPLVNRDGDTRNNAGYLKINIGGGQVIDLNIAVSAAINFLIVAAVVYFLVVLPNNTFRKRREVEQAEDTELTLLTEIRDILSSNGQGRSARERPTEPRHRRDDERRQVLTPTKNADKPKRRLRARMPYRRQ